MNIAIYELLIIDVFIIKVASRETATSKCL